MKGGKGYRSGKHVEVKSEFHEVNTSEGQSIGRVIKHLGDRNVTLFCNDGQQIIAHIRGGLKKKIAKIEVGDIVLYSSRSDGLKAEGGKSKGDVLAKYEQDTHRELKKLEWVNARLFINIENPENKESNNGPDDAFEFDDEESDGEESELEEESRNNRKKKEEISRSNARDTKYVNVEDAVNIDSI